MNRTALFLLITRQVSELNYRIEISIQNEKSTSRQMVEFIHIHRFDTKLMDIRAKENFSYILTTSRIKNVCTNVARHVYLRLISFRKTNYN